MVIVQKLRQIYANLPKNYANIGKFAKFVCLSFSEYKLTLKYCVKIILKQWYFNLSYVNKNDRNF